MTTPITPLLVRMTSLGGHLMKLKPRVKKPERSGWPMALAVTVEEADVHLARGGNIGINLSASRLIAFDCEDTAATDALLRAGFVLTVIPAKAQDPANPKFGGSHTWLRIPDSIVDPLALPGDQLGITLSGGGKIDVLAGSRLVVAPPSQIEEAPGLFYAPCAGGALDLTGPLPDLDEAPAWLFDRALPAPAGLEALAGVLAPPPPRAKVEQDARSVELTNRIDAVDWSVWLRGDARLTPRYSHDACGCQEWHWQGADNEKSATLHDDCFEFGCGVHVWSGTMMAQLRLPRNHLSRLDFAAALHGETTRQTAASVGIDLGVEHEELAAVTPHGYLRMAKDAQDVADSATDPQVRAGYIALAQRYQDAANHLAGLLSTASSMVVLPGQETLPGPVVGVPAPPPNGLLPGEETPATTDDGVGGVVPTGDTAIEAHPAVLRSVVRTIGKARVRSFPGLSFDQIPLPRGDELHEYPTPPVPDHVPPVDGAATVAIPVLPPVASRADHPVVQHEWVWSTTPGLSHVAAAADARGLSRWGLLGALLPRIAAAIPATVRLVPANRAVPSESGPTAAGTSINVFSILVGPPGSGKSDTLNAAATLIPGVVTVPPGTGEGVLKKFPRGDESEDGSDDGRPAGLPDGAPVVGSVGGGNRNSGAVLIESDEIDVFIGEMMRQGSKTLGLYRSMWMGNEVGNTTSDRERHSFVGAHTYRFGIVLGAQPETVATMFGETGKGTPQRFMWLTAHQSVPRGPEYRGQLNTAPVYWFNGSPSMIPELGGERPPVWITPPPAAIEHMDIDRARAATANPFDPAGRYHDEHLDKHLDYGDDDADEDVGGYSTFDDAPIANNTAEAIANRHAVLQQLKMSVLLAALDGLANPQDAHWFAAGAVMAVRRHTIEHLVDTAEQIHSDGLRQRGRDMGITQSHARSASDRETDDRLDFATTRVLAEAHELAKAGRPITRTALRIALDASRDSGGPNASVGNYVNDALRKLTATGALVQTIDGETFVPNSPRLGMQEEPQTGATIHQLRPNIRSVGP